MIKPLYLKITEAEHEMIEGKALASGLSMKDLVVQSVRDHAVPSLHERLSRLSERVSKLEQLVDPSISGWTTEERP